MQVGIDTDLVVYRAAFAAERMEYGVQYEDTAFGEEGVIWVQSAKEAKELTENLLAKDGMTIGERLDRINLEPVEAALYNAKSIIERIANNLDVTGDDITLYFSGERNFREDIATIKPYKGNRENNRKPTHGPAVIEYLQSGKWNYVISDNEEADDVLGCAHYKAFLEDPYSHVIASTDKDLDMIPGLHYNFVKEKQYFVDEEAAELTFWTQLLSGDSVDNIQGVPGIGTVRAKEALSECKTDLDRYTKALALYVQGYGGEFAEAALLENARLIWIRRNEGELWEPPI